MFRRLFAFAVVAAASLCFVHSTSATEFQGSYVGVSAGWSGGSSSTGHILTAPSCGGCGAGPAQTAAVSSISPNLNSNNVTGGIQAGYNWRAGRFVIGVEADINYVGLNKSVTTRLTAATPSPKIVTSTDSVNSNWVATLRPRIGYMPTDKSLVYVTGGVAASDVNFSNASTIFSNGVGSITGVYDSSASKVLGTVIGAGFEYAWMNNINLKVEYQHLEFGNTTLTGGINSINVGTDLANSSITTNANLKANIVRVGANWRY